MNDTQAELERGFAAQRRVGQGGHSTEAPRSQYVERLLEEWGRAQSVVMGTCRIVTTVVDERD